MRKFVMKLVKKKKKTFPLLSHMGHPKSFPRENYQAKSSETRAYGVTLGALELCGGQMLISAEWPAEQTTLTSQQDISFVGHQETKIITIALISSDSHIN